MVECSSQALSIAMKVFGVLGMLYTIANGILRFVIKSKTDTFVIVYYVVGIYLVALGILGILTMFMNKLNFLFKFLDMNNWKGRGFYFIFCALLMFDYKLMRELCCCILMVVIGVIYIICSCQNNALSANAKANANAPKK
jgi:uncharacterized membrane protein HdeD (DUF308 family)